LSAFGNHFKTAHGDCFLNDFQDGTFGILGFHNGKEQPIVVSRERKKIGSMPDEAGTVNSAKQSKQVQPNGEQDGNRPARPVRRDKAPSESKHFEDTPLGRPYTSNSRK
jgi:hypothetical protein